MIYYVYATRFCPACGNQDWRIAVLDCTTLEWRERWTCQVCRYWEIESRVGYYASMQRPGGERE